MTLLIFRLIFILAISCFSVCHVFAAIDVSGGKEILAVSSVIGDGRFPMYDTVYQQNKIPASSISWKDIVFMIFIYDDPATNKLIQAHLNTWITHVGKGADIVFISDSDDTRAINEIIPASDKVDATLHVYKSPARNDGKHLKFKVIDGLRYVERVEFFFKKKFYFKMDADTYVIPENMLKHLNEVHKQTFPLPVHIGWASCAPQTFCYSAGPIYGFNNFALKAVNRYFRRDPKVVSEMHPHPTTGSNLMEHEDYMISYVYNKATKLPIVHCRLMHQKVFNDIGAGLPSTKLVAMSYHPLKDPALFYEYEELFYRSDGSIKTFDELDTIYLRKKEE